jgi:GGDEF domain-containing protein
MRNLPTLITDLYLDTKDFLRSLEFLYKDELTGYPNGRALRRDIRKISRTGCPVLIYSIDMIGLSKLNDNYGHDAGDELIKIGLEISTKVVSYFGGKVYREYGDDYMAILTRVDEDITGSIPARIENYCRAYKNTNPNTKLPSKFPIHMIIGYKFFPDGRNIAIGKNLVGLDDTKKIMSEKKKEFYENNPDLDGRNKNRD